MYVLDNKPGNTGVLGRHFWRIENNDAEDGRQKCLKWTSLHESLDFLSEYNMKVRLDRRMACPCSGSGQAQLDRRFIWDWWNSWPKWCFRSRLSINLELYSRDKGILTFTLKQLCCYSTQWPGDWGALKTGPPDGGRLEVEVFNQRSLRVEEVLTDQEAYKHCCVDTPLCSLFYKYRPSDNCDLYVPPITRKCRLFYSKFLYTGISIYLFILTKKWCRSFRCIYPALQLYLFTSWRSNLRNNSSSFLFEKVIRKQNCYYRFAKSNQ